MLGQIDRIAASMRLFGYTLSGFGGMHLHVKKLYSGTLPNRTVSLLAPGSGSRRLHACVLVLYFAIQRLPGGAKVTFAMCLCAGSCNLHIEVLNAIELQQLSKFNCRITAVKPKKNSSV